MRIVKNNVIVINGINTRLFLSPGIDKVRRVISKFVNDIVVLIPDNKTIIMAVSCAPKPVYWVLAENGVINVQPDIVKILFEQRVACNFFRLVFATPTANRQYESAANGSKRVLVNFTGIKL